MAVRFKSGRGLAIGLAASLLAVTAAALPLSTAWAGVGSSGKGTPPPHASWNNGGGHGSDKPLPKP